MHADPGHTRVLVVDDDPIFRTPLCAVLVAAGFDVRSTDSAEAAEDLLAREPVDVVLSDVGLPRMDGTTLACRHPATPFVLMTGSPPAESPASAATLPPSVRARLVKPLDVPRLLSLLREAALGPRVRAQAVGP
jgi:two-component system C4-dicarboxylate transport response regulator DctD